MNKWVVGIGSIVVLAGGYISMAHFSGGSFPTLGLPIGGERADLRSITLQFIEDVKFKDFEKAATYHHPDKQDTLDIPFYIERLFLIKPEALDVMSYEIVFVEMDSSKLRGRVKARIKCKNLIRENIHEKEAIFFFHRDSLNDPWYMVLESSLRKTEKDKNKK